MYSFTRDLTSDYKVAGSSKIDVSGWENITFQILNPAGPINFLGSNDPVAITGVSDGSAVSSENYYAIQAVHLADGTEVTQAAASGLYSIKILTRFIQIEGGDADKIIYFVNKLQ